MASAKGSVSGEKHRLLIVDDHPVLREGLRALIDSEDDLMVCGEAEDAGEAFALIPRVRPHLALVDLSLKDSHGLDLIKNIAATFPEVLSLVVSAYDERDFGERSLRAGARGYVHKTRFGAELLRAVRQVLAGELCVSSSLAARLLGSALGAPVPATPPTPVTRLNDRELQIFQMLGEGLDTKPIAAALHLDHETVERYYGRIRRKLGLTNGHELLRAAVLWALESRSSDAAGACPPPHRTVHP